MSNVVTNDLTNADLIPTPTPITTGASPVTADINVRHYSITSGGTNAQETIVLPTPALSGDGSNTGWVGQTIIFAWDVQTSGSDSILITSDDPGHPIEVVDNYGVTVYGDVLVPGPERAIIFTWSSYNWSISFNYADALAYPANILSGGGYYPQTAGTVNGSLGASIATGDLPAGATDQSGNVQLKTGDASAADGQKSGRIDILTGPAGAGRAAGEIAIIVGSSGAGADGSAVSLIAGDGGTGDTAGGDILLRAGAGSGAGTHGNVIFSDLPTADPHVANALWNNAGVLTISAG